MEMSLWDHLVKEALSKLESLKLLRSLRPIHLPSDEEPKSIEIVQNNALNSDEFVVFDELQQWNRA
ncbi:8-amino-7-oxononanoate synthase, partial [Sarracenia purpurea var. burkii]